MIRVQKVALGTWFRCHSSKLSGWRALRGCPSLMASIDLAKALVCWRGWIISIVIFNKPLGAPMWKGRVCIRYWSAYALRRDGFVCNPGASFRDTPKKTRLPDSTACLWIAWAIVEYATTTEEVAYPFRKVIGPVLFGGGCWQAGQVALLGRQWLRVRWGRMEELRHGRKICHERINRGKSCAFLMGASSRYVWGLGKTWTWCKYFLD